MIDSALLAFIALVQAFRLDVVSAGGCGDLCVCAQNKGLSTGSSPSVCCKSLFIFWAIIINTFYSSDPTACAFV